MLSNAGMVALQAVVTGLVLFVLYSIILRALGVEALGLWSLVLATASVGRISEMGMSGCAVRYVSRHLANDDVERAIASLQTIMLTVALMLSVFCLLLYPAIYLFLPRLLDGDNLTLGRELLPYALFSLWCTGFAASAQMGVDGAHRAGLRAGMAMISSVTMLGLAILLIPMFGLFGLAYAQIAQAILLFVLNWAVLRRLLPGLPLWPRQWTKEAFLEMWKYALNYQFIDLMNILTAPITKALISYFGDLSFLGYYEMADRMVAKVREIVVNANRVIVPYFSKLTETDQESLPDLLRQNMQIMTLLGCIVMGGIAAIAPSVSILWAGEYVWNFTLSVWVLAAGWTATVMSAPAYFLVLGSNDIRLLSVVHAVQMIVNFIGAILLGSLMGAFGPVIAWTIALFAMSAVLVIVLYRKGDMGRLDRGIGSLFVMSIGTILSVGCAWFVFHQTEGNFSSILVLLLQGISFMACMIIPLALNPTARSLLARLLQKAK